MATRFIGGFLTSQTLEIIIPTTLPIPKKEINKLLVLIEINMRFSK